MKLYQRSRWRLSVRASTFAVIGLSAAMVMAACSSGSEPASSTQTSTPQASATTQPADTGGGGDGGGGDSDQNASASAPPLTLAWTGWGTTWSYNPWSPNSLSYLDGVVKLRLAVPKFPSMTEYFPKLADKWSAKNGKLTVHLRSGVNWQDGKPVTSKDVYDTMVLDGLNGNVVWNDISGISTPSADTVVFTLRDGVPSVLAAYDILRTVIQPSSVYGKFVTPDLMKAEVKYYTTNAKDPDAAAKLPEYATMQDVFKKLAAFPRKTALGDGPFKVENITTQKETFSKWDGFYAADKITASGMVYINSSNQSTIFPQLLSGSIDWSNAHLPGPIAMKLEKTPDMHIALPPGVGRAFVFNDHQYPLNMVKVRQALAYTIPRKTIIAAAFGTSDVAGAVPTEHPDGLDPNFESRYLTKKQLDSLNTYPVDAGKASSLLESAGFQKKGDQWYMPNGKQFTITILVNSGDTTTDVTATSAAKAMSAFGIKTTVNGENGPQWAEDLANGNFTMSTSTIGGTNPLQFVQRILGSAHNFIKTGQYAGKRGFGYGPVVDVPGLGKVNVPETIDKQVATVSPGPKMKKLAWSWAQLINEQVPYLWYGTERSQMTYSTKRFTNWPPLNSEQTNLLFNISANFSQREMLVEAMEQGYLDPVK